MVDWQEVNAGVGQAAIVLVTGIHVLVYILIHIYFRFIYAFDPISCVSLLFCLPRSQRAFTINGAPCQGVLI